MTNALVTYERKAFVDRWGHKHPAVIVKRSAPKDAKKKRRRKKKSSKEKKWYQPKVRSGWKKDMPARKRRRLLLKAHRGSLLSAARSKQSLANVTQDEETRVLALADAKYFFEEHKKSKKV